MKRAFQILHASRSGWAGVAFCLMVLSARAQSSRLEWVRTAGGLGEDRVQYLAMGSNGVVYVTGRYGQRADFGGVVLTNDVCCGVGSFLASYGRDGSLRWARSLGPLFSDQAPAVMTAASGGVRLAGFVSGTGEIDGTPVFGPGLWLATYSADGAPEGAKVIPTAWLGGTQLTAAASDAEGNTFLCGNFSGALQLGELSLASANQSADLFVGAIDATGGMRWLRKAGGAGTDGATAIGVDDAGRVYVTGSFQQQANFSGVVVESPSWQAMFVAQYGPTGSLGWVRAADSTGPSNGQSLTVAAGGGCHLAGFAAESLRLGGETVTVTAGRGALMLAACDAEGSVTWIRGVEVETQAAPTTARVARDGKGYLYLAGGFGPRIWVEGHEFRSVGETDLFVTRFDATGRAGWTELGGFIYQDLLAGVLAGGDQQLILAGHFLDSFLWGDRYLEGAGAQDAFVVSLSTSPLQPEIREIHMVPALLVEGARGSRMTLEYASRPEATNWTVLTNLSLVESPSWFIDLSATNTQQRYYRLVAEE